MHRRPSATAPPSPPRVATAPRALPDGGRIRVVSVASPVSLDSFQRGVELLRSRGFQVDYNAALLNSDHPYLAAPDVRRLEDLIAAFDDPRVDAVICARGGYGSLRLLPGFDARLLARRRKPFVGFSDITAFHLALNQWGLVTFHGPVVTVLGGTADPDERVTQLVDLMQGRIPIPFLVKGQPGAGGRARGTLVGGNLSLLAACLPTGLVQLPEPCVLFLEEVEEPLYRIDRMLTQLRLGGFLDPVVGFALGSFTGCGQSEREQSWSPVQVALECLTPCAVPVVSDLPVGHGEKDGTLPLGTEVEIDGDCGTLILSWPENSRPAQA